MEARGFEPLFLKLWSLITNGLLILSGYQHAQNTPIARFWALAVSIELSWAIWSRIHSQRKNTKLFFPKDKTTPSCLANAGRGQVE